METTFGKTVETRFINLNSQNLPKNNMNLSVNQSIGRPFMMQRNFNPSLASSEINHNNNINFNSYNKNHQQQQHIYLNRYKDLQESSQLFRQNQVSMPSSAILMRKNFKHFLNVSSNNGYSSDGGDYSSITNNITEKLDQPKCPQLKFKRLNTSFNNYNSDYNEYDEELDDKDDLRSCISMRTNYNISDREYNEKLMRYKSIERQHAKFAREHKNYQENKKIEQNKIDLYRYKYLSDRLNEQNSNLKQFSNVNNRLAHLLSPQMPVKSRKLSTNANTGINYNERIQYLLNKNNQRLKQQQNQQQLKCRQNYHTIDYQQRVIHNAKNNNNLDLVNYLTWKNFGNIYPMASDETKSSLMSPTNLTPQKDDERNNFSENSSSFYEPIRVNTKSMSTPNTPRLFTLPRCSRIDESTQMKKNSNFLNYEQFNENLKQKELEFQLQLKNKINKLQINAQTKQQANLTSQNEPILNSLEFPNEEKDSIEKSKIEVVPLENALLNMNEILKNLTLNFQKKLNESRLESDYQYCENSIQPINKTNEEQGNIMKHENSFENCIINLSPSSSKSSTSSSSYSNSSKTTNLGENLSLSKALDIQDTHLKNDQEKSFSQSSSMNSCSSSVSDSSDVGIPASSSSVVSSSTTSSSNTSDEIIAPNSNITISKRIQLTNESNNLIENNLVTNKKKESLSFGKKLKRFLSLNSKRQRDPNPIIAKL